MTGAEVIAEMIQELFTSADMGAQFEGDMRRLASYARCAWCLRASCACGWTAMAGGRMHAKRREGRGGGGAGALASRWSSCSGSPCQT